ncbi:hypothetical protein J5Y09_21200 [Roseomonas sp. PWR1]|uniref:Uncharacterized protein n=1 Tax=Roseomonas nitratireducens TaxID=2820810 RepID=A0ABS4AYL2_9PROT|nr:hypothetical protein [Neoroseomonas nitratireducens]MBP0466459.1 hypothetical protein [Neoroseomonas nitratireducens]
MPRSWPALVIALLLCLAALVQPARAETIAVTPPGGGACLLRAAPPGTQAREAAALAAEAEALRAMAARLLADAAVMRLGAAREGVPRFGDWAYGWVQSYVTSYRILARAASGLAQSIAEPGEGELVARLAEEMAEPLRAEFRTRVLAPVLATGGYADDLAHVGAVIDAAWEAALAASAARVARLPAAPAGAAPSHALHFAAAARPIGPVLQADATTDPMALIAEEGTDGSAAFLRSVRPLAARLGAVLVRISEVGSVVAAGGAFGFAMAGASGTMFGIAGGIGVAWGVDWLFNRVDAALNRTAFEAQALDAIARAERRLAAEASGIAAATLAARLAALGRMEACP